MQHSLSTNSNNVPGYRQRLGTLDSVPENAIAPSPSWPNNSGQQQQQNHQKQQQYQGQLQVPESATKRPRYLRKADGVPIHQKHEQLQPVDQQQSTKNSQIQNEIEPVMDKPKLLPNKDVSDKDTKNIEIISNNDKSLAGGQWTKGITNLTMTSVGVVGTEEKRTGSSSTVTRGASNTRAPQTANSSMGNSRQTSSIGLDNSNQYSEDFESVSELDL
ncbi:hypothetical protein PoB_003558000 [Plakobranchus ocellatus]|uniref:Uncharacterized protein n=1 Tax=Plakobranchus ocellatus TaxID=259542 RepID=A0AAV4AQC9_9GAST|nr:hypothetical protein PoB_003558000 [Plakobranchus ocellatus]